LLRRYLTYSGYDVFHIMNLTDVDDRTIKAAAAAGKRLEAHTAPFVQAFFEDRDYLRITPAHVYPRATQSVPAMVRLVERLLERGVAYRSDDGSIYFAIAKFPSYGRLSRLDTRELKVGARVASDEYAKDDPRVSGCTASSSTCAARRCRSGSGIFSRRAICAIRAWTPRRCGSSSGRRTIARRWISPTTRSRPRVRA